MKKNVVIMISASPVDGYPPVQHQAALLSEAGLRVVLITTTLSAERKGVRFRHPRVSVRGVRSTGRGWINCLRRNGALASLITASRLRNRSHVLAEICFEPLGVFLSDLCPFRPAARIAHFHETLMRMETWKPERRLPFALRRFQKIVTPDAGRARLLQGQTRLLQTPLVVPNYPKLEPPCRETAAKRAGFEVIYSGSLAFDKKLDVIIKSIRLWPAQARLTLLGDDTRPEAQQLKRVARDTGLADRVHFEGWLDLDLLGARLRQAHLAISLLDPATDQWKFSVGASNKRYQYMQAGLPQIGDNNPGVPELLESHGVGRCVRAFAEREIADLVSYYAGDDAVTRQEGHRAELLYRDRLNYDAAFRPLLDWILTDAHRYSN